MTKGILSFLSVIYKWHGYYNRLCYHIHKDWILLKCLFYGIESGFKFLQIVKK